MFVFSFVCAVKVEAALAPKPDPVQPAATFSTSELFDDELALEPMLNLGDAPSLSLFSPCEHRNQLFDALSGLLLRGGRGRGTNLSTALGETGSDKDGGRRFRHAELSEATLKPERDLLGISSNLPRPVKCQRRFRERSRRGVRGLDMSSCLTQFNCFCEASLRSSLLPFLFPYFEGSLGNQGNIGSQKCMHASNSEGMHRRDPNNTARQ